VRIVELTRESFTVSVDVNIDVNDTHVQAEATTSSNNLICMIIGALKKKNIQ